LRFLAKHAQVDGIVCESESCETVCQNSDRQGEALSEGGWVQAM